MPGVGRLSRIRGTLGVGQSLNAEYSCRLAQTTEETDMGVAEIQSIMQVEPHAAQITKAAV